MPSRCASPTLAKWMNGYVGQKLTSLLLSIAICDGVFQLYLHLCHLCNPDPHATEEPPCEVPQACASGGSRLRVRHRDGVQVPVSKGCSVCCSTSSSHGVPGLPWLCGTLLFFVLHCCKCFCYFYTTFILASFFFPKSVLIAWLLFNPSDSHLHL